MTNEREKLRGAALALQSWCGERGEQLLEEFMAAVDELVAAERLDEHVKTCEAVGGVFPKDNKAWRHCGDKWYCDRAPIKERESS